MAISTLPPSIDWGQHPRLKIITAAVSANAQSAHPRKFIAALAGIFLAGLLSLLLINTLLTQDAFVLQRLKHQANMALDQRDALIQQLAFKSSPDQLATLAVKIGMVPGNSLQFIDVTKVSEQGGVPTRPSVKVTQ